MSVTNIWREVRGSHMPPLCFSGPTAWQMVLWMKFLNSELVPWNWIKKSHLFYLLPKRKKKRHSGDSSYESARSLIFLQMVITKTLARVHRWGAFPLGKGWLMMTLDFAAVFVSLSSHAGLSMFWREHTILDILSINRCFAVLAETRG